MRTENQKFETQERDEVINRLMLQDRFEGEDEEDLAVYTHWSIRVPQIGETVIIDDLDSPFIKKKVIDVETSNAIDSVHIYVILEK